MLSEIREKHATFFPAAKQRCVVNNIMMTWVSAEELSIKYGISTVS